MLSFQLSDTQKEIRAHARKFALEEVLPKAWQYDEKDQTPMDVLENDAGIWRCAMCGHVHYGEEPPETCPVCLFPKGALQLY